MPLLAWLAKIASSPLVAGVLIPSLSRSIESFLTKMANRIETKSAIKQSKAAKTAEELREAAQKLTDSINRR